MKFFEALSGGNTIKNIKPDVAYENLKKDKNIVLLDVREKDEFAIGHIQGARNVPLSNMTQEISRLVPHKDKTIYVYCLSGARSTRASNLLKQMGYTEVYNLGGIAAWPYEIVK